MTYRHAGRAAGLRAQLLRRPPRGRSEPRRLPNVVGRGPRRIRALRRTTSTPPTTTFVQPGALYRRRGWTTPTATNLVTQHRRARRRTTSATGRAAARHPVLEQRSTPQLGAPRGPPGSDNQEAARPAMTARRQRRSPGSPSPTPRSPARPRSSSRDRSRPSCSTTHSRRVFLWGSLQAEEERPELRPPSCSTSARCSTTSGLVRGGHRSADERLRDRRGPNAARAFLERHGLAEDRVMTVWESIALHTTPGGTALQAARGVARDPGVEYDVLGPATSTSFSADQGARRSVWRVHRGWRFKAGIVAARFLGGHAGQAGGPRSGR